MRKLHKINFLLLCVLTSCFRGKTETQKVDEFDKLVEYCLMLDSEKKEKSQDFNYSECIENLSKERNLNISQEKIANTQKKLDDKVIYITKECLKYAENEEKLTKCQETLTKIKQCNIDLDEKISQRTADDKIYCKRISIKKYPDSLAVFNNSPVSNFGPKIDKIEMVNLREKEYNKCYIHRNKKLQEYKNYLENECKMTNLKILEEKNN